MTKPAKKQGNPYKVLYWMGGGLLLLAIGVVALIMFTSKDHGPAPEHERTLLWLYDGANPKGPAQAAILEETRSAAKLSAITFLPDDATLKIYSGKQSRKTVEHVAAGAGRQIHHRVFLPYSVVSTLIDAAHGITVEGKQLKGSEAVSFIKDGGEQSARRAAQVMLALADAAATRGVDMSVSQGLRLAQDLDTDFDITDIPNILGRWSEYSNPAIAPGPGNDLAAIGKLLQPDPQPTGK